MSLVETRIQKSTVRPTKKRKYSQMEMKQYQIAQRAIADANRKSEEKKRHVAEFSLRDIDNAGQIQQLTTINQGDGYNERVGDQLTVNNVLIRYKIQLNRFGNTDHSSIRIIVFKWLAEDAPVYSDILTSAGFASTGALQPIVHTNRMHFRILYDNLICLSPSSETMAVEKVYLKNCGQVHYYAASSSNKKGNIYLLAVSDDNTLANEPTMSATWSVSFHDQ